MGPKSSMNQNQFIKCNKSGREYVLQTPLHEEGGKLSHSQKKDKKESKSH